MHGKDVLGEINSNGYDSHLLFGLRAVVRRARGHIEARRDADRLALNLQNAELVSTERMATLLLRGMTTLALGFAVLALYFHLSLASRASRSFSARCCRWVPVRPSPTSSPASC
jgi:hypothetical protein